MSKRTTREGGTQVANIPLFMVTLPRTEKSQDIFKFTYLCNIITKVEADRAQTDLTQCYNCQRIGHVGVNCKQHPRCVWCGRGHLHMECPEREKQESSPTCCNCTLKDGERPHPSTYRGCSYAKEEMLRRRIHRSYKKRDPQEGCSPQTLSFPGNPSLRLCAATRNSNSLTCGRIIKCSQTRWTGRRSSFPCSRAHNKQVSQFRPPLNTVSLWTTCSWSRL
jgi:hypothetical protein